MNNWGHFIHRNKWVRCHNLSETKSFRILRTDVWQNKIILRQRLARLCLGPVEAFIKMATQPEIPDLSIYLFKSYPSLSIWYDHHETAENSRLHPFSVKLAIYLCSYLISPEMSDIRIYKRATHINNCPQMNK